MIVPADIGKESDKRAIRISANINKGVWSNFISKRRVLIAVIKLSASIINEIS